MPPKSCQPPNSSHQASGPYNVEGVDTSDGLVDLSTDLEKFLKSGNEGSPEIRNKKIKELMERISSTLPEDHPDLSKNDRTHSLRAIEVHIKQRSPMALDFLSLIGKRAFEELRLHVCCFSDLTMNDKLMNPETLTIHDPIEAGIILSQWKSITTVQPLKFPTPEEYNVVTKLMDIFNTVFDQSSEQSAVIKVAAYSMLLHLQNINLCTMYFPEFSLFSITPKESAAEVVARVNMNDYRYFLTGRADAFIVSLTAEKDNTLSILAGEEVQKEFRDACDGLVAPKYRLLVDRLQDLVTTLNELQETSCFSYEIVVLEVKKLQPIAKIKGMELKNHLKQVIGECAAIHEYGFYQCQFIKFILSDGDRWLFGVLQNPKTNAVGFNTQRECFYAIVDNSNSDLMVQITEMLAFWMTIPGNKLYDSFFGN